MELCPQASLPGVGDRDGGSNCAPAGEGNREIRGDVDGLGATSGNERRVAFDGADYQGRASSAVEE